VRAAVQGACHAASQARHENDPGPQAEAYSIE
jgi:hypothetical protein